jgi:hypothetical protein
MSTHAIEDLELEALEQRNRLHHNAGELRAKLDAARESLNVSKKTREHFVKASLSVAAIALRAGYAFAGMFTRH